jgi:hypothetical protein
MSVKRSRSPQGRQAQPIDEEEELRLLEKSRRVTGVTLHLRYLPFGFIFSLLEIFLYVTVCGVSLTDDLPYIIVAYLIGVAGLTIAYSFVAQWVQRKRSAATKSPVTGSEHVWFALFYNNAFYVFLVFLGSHLLFSTIDAKISLVLTQVVAVGLPAWMSGLAK